ncbi:putative ribonuclease H-like domain-containing protein [Tanacetum coccineum]
MSASQDEIPPPPPPPPSSSQTPTQQTPHTVSTIKLPILKKGEYDIWAMKMEHYLAHTDYPIWEVIQNGNGPVSITTDTSGQIKVLPPRTAEEIVARERERKARTTLLMALPEDHLAKFHKMTDAKEMWDAIKSRFGGNDESKKMQKYILKQQFEGFSVSNTEGLHKGYDRFQSLLSQLEIHGAGVSTEDANQKFLRSLPSAWSQVSLIMRTKPGVDSLSFDDLYNNLRVFESDIKGSTASSSSPQNVAFVSENTSSTNEVSTAYCVPNLSGQNTKYEQTSSYSLLANQSSCPQLDHEDLEQIDEYDLEEMDLKWQVAMISMRMKKFYKKTGRKLQFDAKEAEIEIDYSQFTYGPKQTQPSESESQSSECDTCESNISTEPSELVSEPVVNETNVESQPKVWSDAPIIEEYESDSEDECVSIPIKQQETPSFANQQVKTPRENVKSQNTHSQKPKVDKKELGHGFAVRACFVCVNKQHQFVPSAVLTRTGIIPVSTARASSTKNFSTARQSVNRQTVLTNAAMKVNTVKPIVNRVRPANAPDWKQVPTIDEFKTFNRCPVAFGGSKGDITELQHFNLFSVSQICDKKNKVLFTDSECLVLSPEFKLPDENQVLLKIPRQNNMYSFNLENIVPTGGLACLIAKATTDESNKWHRRLGHVNFKNLNKLVKGNLVRGLPSKIFQNDHTCVACQKGKQHKASCKAKAVSSISQTLQLLHMDLFGPTSVRSLNHKTYCLVITDDFSRFSWVFFLRTKDETSAILKDFIRQIENQLNQKVKTIRSDNGTEFKNKEVIEFCGLKGIKREYSNARTPQQNGVAERKNRTLIEAARTMLADSFLPNTFWAEAVSTACYVLNRVLVTKPHNKTPYELLTGKIPIISYIRPFGCHVTILNTIDHLAKFAGKSDEGFLVGYSLQSKAFRVYNLETKRVEENLHITFLENKPNVAGKGPNWLFDLDYLTDSMNYHPVSSENQANLHAGQQEANQNAGTEDIIDVGDSDKEDDSAQDCFVLPIWPSYSSTNTPALTTDDKREGPREEEQVFMDDLERLKKQEKEAYEEAEALRKKFETLVIKEGAAKPSSTNIFSTVSTPAKASSTNCWDS